MEIWFMIVSLKEITGKTVRMSNVTPQNWQ